MKNHYEMNPDKYLSTAEINQLREILSRLELTPRNIRDTTLIRFALESGARAQECLNVTLEDLDAQYQRVFIRGLKNSKDRFIPISPWLFDRIKKLAEENPNKRPFDIHYNTFRYIWNQYRPPSCSKKLHSLRHTRAIELYEQTKDLRLVQKLLGHRSIQNTMVYLDVASDDQLFSVRPNYAPIQ